MGSTAKTTSECENYSRFSFFLSMTDVGCLRVAGWMCGQWAGGRCVGEWVGGRRLFVRVGAAVCFRSSV
jgi:hypothetical protein